MMAERCAVASSGVWPPERKAMPGTAEGTVSFNTLTVYSATCSTDALRTFLPSMTMLGFSIDAFEVDAGFRELLEDDLQRPAGHFLAAGEVMRAGFAIHQHFGFDDRYDLRLLAKRGVAGQRMGVGLHGAKGRQLVGDGDDAPPLGEAGAGVIIFRQAVSEAVEALGDGFTGKPAIGLAPVSTLMPGIAAGGSDNVDQGGTVDSLLEKGFLGKGSRRRYTSFIASSERKSISR